MKATGWQSIPLGDIIRQRKEFVLIDDAVCYKRCRVQLHARGIVLRDTVAGADIKTKSQQFCKSGELLVAEIDAKVGGFGIVPEELDGAIVSSHYFLFTIDEKKLDRRFLDYFIRTKVFREQVTAQGTTNYAAIRSKDVLSYRIPLPPLAEQKLIAKRIEEVLSRTKNVNNLQCNVNEELDRLLIVRYLEVVGGGCKYLPMSDVAPLVRRPITIEPGGKYPELGIRSFGKGTFHKPDLAGVDVGTKKLFTIHEGDLLFNIVFAWEGAVAVAGPEDHGRVGSHRFLTCLPKEDVVLASFLRFHFLTRKGLDDLLQASPGGAGRNRTLGLAALANIRVPIPQYESQLKFENLVKHALRIKKIHAEQASDIDALLQSILLRAFRGEF